MTTVKWIKLSVNMFDDEKIKLIKTMPEGHKIIVIWVQLLCLAGKTNDGGLVYMGQNLSYTDEMLATILDMQINVIRVAIQALEQLGMIEVKEDGRIDILSWNKHQNIEGLDRIKRQDADRQRVYYYRTKLKEIGIDVTDPNIPNSADKIKDYYNSIKKNLTLGLRDSHGTELEEEGEKEEERDKELQLEEKQNAAANFEIIKVSNFFQNNFNNLNQHIKEDLKSWIEEIGSDLVLEAMKRAVEAEKNYNYAKGIMKSWKQNSIKNLKDVKEEDEVFAKRKKSSYSKQRSVQKETLPEWAREDYEPPKEEVSTKSEEINDRLSRLQEYKKERGIIQ